MRAAFAAILLTTLAAGQEQAPPGVLRGTLIAVDSGGFQVRSTTGVAYRCNFDGRTYMEREGQRVFDGALRPEDNVEVIADRNAAGCYARTIRIIRPAVMMASRRSPLPRPYRVLDTVFPRGNMTFAGVIRRVSPEMLVLHTRTEPEKVVLLRDDTRYLAGGWPVDFSQLAVNTRVFIRGGNNIENRLEAYQVIWGEITGPKRD